MAKKPNPPKSSGAKMMGAAKSMKVDPTDYMGRKPKPKAMGPKKPMRPKPKGSAGIGENLPNPYKRPKKKPTSGSTSARIRNMEKMYSKRRGIREL